MITKVEADRFIQKCECGDVHYLPYEDLVIKGKFITLPTCLACETRIEVLHNNNGEDDHSILVSKIFANVATKE